MADLRNAIGSLVTEPQTLQAQRTGQSFFVDETTTPVPNEGNLLSLMTMRDFYKDKDNKVPEDINLLLKNVAQEESRYMMTALAVLADKAKTLFESRISSDVTLMPLNQLLLF